MSTTPLVSILIPVRNRERMVKRAVESAVAQTYANIEIIVGDNCSSDRTYEVVKKIAADDERIICFRNDTNLGPVRNWLRCLQKSRGKYIQILFSDDWLEREAIECLLNALVENNSGFVYSTVELHDESNNRVRLLYQQEQSSSMDGFSFARARLTGIPHVPFSPGCAMFRQSDLLETLVEEIPTRLNLDCTFKGIGPDLLLFLRQCEKYSRVFHLNRRLCHFTSHQGSITNRHSKSLRHFCYDAAFGYFLATSHIPLSQKRRLNGLLFLRSCDPSRMKLTKSYSPWNAYVRLFPKTYNYRDIRILPQDIITLSFGLVTHTILSNLSWKVVKSESI